MVRFMIQLLVVISMIWVYLDATKHKIGRIPDTGGFFNMSAGAWGTAAGFLWIVGFPSYLIKRRALIEKAKDAPVEPKHRAVKTAIFCLIGVVELAVVFWPG
jgi:hypothetical protein